MNMPEAPELAITDLFVTLWRRRIIAVVSFLIILGTIAVLVANRSKTVSVSALVMLGKVNSNTFLVNPNAVLAKLSLDLKRADTTNESLTNSKAIADSIDLQLISNEIIELHAKVPAPLADSTIATMQSIVGEEIERQDVRFTIINNFRELNLSGYQVQLTAVTAEGASLVSQIDRRIAQLNSSSNTGEEITLSYTIIESLSLRHSNNTQQQLALHEKIAELNLEKQQQIPMKFIAEPRIESNPNSLNSFMIMLGGALFAACVAMLLAFLADALARARTLCIEHERPPSTAS